MDTLLSAFHRRGDFRSYDANVYFKDAEGLDVEASQHAPGKVSIAFTLSNHDLARDQRSRRHVYTSVEALAAWCTQNDVPTTAALALLTGYEAIRPVMFPGSESVRVD